MRCPTCEQAGRECRSCRERRLARISISVRHYTAGASTNRHGRGLAVTAPVQCAAEPNRWSMPDDDEKYEATVMFEESNEMRMDQEEIAWFEWTQRHAYDN